MYRILAMIGSRLPAASVCLMLAACGASAEPSAKTPASDMSPTVTACRACHQGPLSLSGRPVADIERGIKAIASGSPTHPPVALEGIDDAAVKALAEALAKP